MKESNESKKCWTLKLENEKGQTLFYGMEHVIMTFNIPAVKQYNQCENKRTYKIMAAHLVKILDADFKNSKK